MKDKFGFNIENTYLKLPEIFYSKQNPTKVKSPKLIKFNYKLAEELGLNIQELINEEGVEILAGNKAIANSTSIAQAYAGHQFGHFTMLGDGRAILLGEHITPNNKKYDIQLKGSGRTPYSRGGDGRAALGPMLREYIISEAMKGLNIKTTRSLAVVETGENILRDEIKKGAILTRVASSHIRVGTFEFAARFTSLEDLKALADYTIERHFNNLKDKENKYHLLLKEVIEKQADLVSRWQLVGFIHGVMNTDNITIYGETIDYGPCAFMDVYDSNTVFSSIDYNGRYAYSNQPNMAAWGLARFAEALLPLLSEDREEAIKIAQDEISNFSKIYKDKWYKGMREKLGLFNEEEIDNHLIEAILSIMEKYHLDYTNTFRTLTINKIEEETLSTIKEFKEWYKLWNERLQRQNKDKTQVKKLMESKNPVVIPRNNLVEEALKEATENNNYKVMEELLNILSTPYDYERNYDNKYLYPKIAESPYKTYCGT